MKKAVAIINIDTQATPSTTTNIPIQCPESVDISFEKFVQTLPADLKELAYEFTAFTRSRKIKDPLQLIQLVMLYCGLDLSVRSYAGEVA